MRLHPNYTPKPTPPGKMSGKVPQVMQMEALECGAASLAMIMAYYGKWVPLEKVRSDCGVSRDGSNALSIIKAARNYGLEASGYRYEPEALREKGQFPCICHINFSHFIVVRGFKGDTVYINDPARGETTLDFARFDKQFTGVTLQFTPNENFVADGKPASIRGFAMERLRGAKAALVFVALTAAIGAAMSAISPLMSQIFMDRLLTGKEPTWVVPYLILLAAFSIIQVTISALNTVYLKRVEGKMAAVSNSSFLWKILHMPMDFFSQRMAGDISQRMATNSSIASTLVSKLAPVGVNLVMLIAYLVIMINYSPWLAALGLGSSLVSFLTSRAISKKRINSNRVMSRDAANLNATSMNAISMIETIKAQGVEASFFRRWSGIQASVNRQWADNAKGTTAIDLIPRFISMLNNALLLGIGVWFIVNGQFTTGSLLSMQTLIQQFSSPVSSLVSLLTTIQEMRTDMERIQDVMQYPNDPMCDPEREADKNPATDKLHGQVDLNDVTFGYNKLGKPVVENFSLHVKPGGCVALVGSSGCGKSTIAKLISGIYMPWSGEILVDGTPLEDIPRSVRCGSIAVIDQDIMLFNDTISNNIKLWDNSVENYEVILAARDAQIHDDIMAKQGGYEHVLAENGRDLSGGQRQRIEIARALAMDPTVIIMDEATSALDAQTECKVMEAVRRRGATLIVIAHRLSTVRDADEIIVFDHGTVVERGTHEELYAAGGAYTNLVSQE
jgi:NHLM bacteriocin system ABC transporter peptidase/ATP-binding protein